MSDPIEVKPRDLRTCREKQDAAIADLGAAVGYTNAATERLVRDLEALAVRVAALEAAPVAVPILGSVTWDSGTIRWRRGATPGGWRKVWEPETHGADGSAP